jgi:hypothetical protein
MAGWIQGNESLPVMITEDWMATTIAPEEDIQTGNVTELSLVTLICETD